MFNQVLRKRLGVMAAILSVAPVVTAAPIVDYLNVKGYTEFFGGAPNPRKTFNYSGKPVFHSIPFSGTARIVFEDLASFAYRPTIQVTPRAVSGNGIPNCGARLETQGTNLIAVVSCRVATPEFTLLIVDETSDGAHTAATSCPNCIATNIHNPWARNTTAPVRLVNFTDRQKGIFFKVDSRATLFQITPPMPFVTPVSSMVRCLPITLDSNSERADEYGVEVSCLPPPPPSSPTVIPRPPVDLSFHLLLVPRSARTGFVLGLEDGRARFLSSEAGIINTTRLGEGRYQVSFPNLADQWVDDGIALVNAHGVLGRTCALEGQFRSGGDVQIELACKNSSGVLMDTQFIVLVTSRH